MKDQTCLLLDSKDLFLDKQYWETVKQNIWTKRSQKEASIYGKSLMSLSKEDQDLVLDLQHRELWEFGKEMGFEVGSYVVDKTGKQWRVVWISSMSGLLRVEDIHIHIEDERGIWNDLWSRERELNGVDEDNYFDYYTPT